MLYQNKSQNTKYHTVGLIPKSNIKITERCKFDTPNTQIHDRSLSSLYTGTSQKWRGQINYSQYKEWITSLWTIIIIYYYNILYGQYSSNAHNLHAGMRKHYQNIFVIKQKGTYPMVMF